MAELDAGEFRHVPTQRRRLEAKGIDADDVSGIPALWPHHSIATGIRRKFMNCPESWEPICFAKLPMQGPVELGPYWTSPNTSRNVARDEEAGNVLRGANMNTMTACIKHGPHYPLQSGELLRWDELIPLARQLSDRVALLIDENTEESLEVATMLAPAIMVIPILKKKDRLKLSYLE